jgi:hypothetical protein
MGNGKLGRKRWNLCSYRGGIYRFCLIKKKVNVEHNNHFYLIILIMIIRLNVKIILLSNQ